MSAISQISGLLLTPCMAAAAPAQPPSARVSLPAAEVRTVDRTYSNVEIIGLTAPSGLRMVSGKDDISIPIEDLVRITFGAERESRSGRQTPGTIRWSLAGGDCLIGQVISSDKGEVSIQDAHLAIVSVPLEVIQGLEVTQATSFRKSAAWFARVAANGDDMVLLTNGDVLRGFLSEITSDGLVWDLEAGASTIPYRLLVAARLANVADAGSAALKTLRVRIELSGGSKVTLSDFRLGEETVLGRTSFGENVSFAGKAMVALEIEGGRWEWLSAREPVSVQQTPMLGLAWDWRADASVTGGPLVVAKQTFDRGIGVHSKSTLGYELSGAYSELVTSFGLDDSAGSLADVNVSILVDGQEKFAQANVRAGELHGPIRIDVSGASRLELVVDYGRNGDIQDRFNWIEPGLVREAE